MYRVILALLLITPSAVQSIHVGGGSVGGGHFASQSDDSSDVWNPTGDPIGGGAGYSDSVRHQTADYVVTGAGVPLDSLTAYLAAASPGEVVYVIDTLEIDASSEVSAITIPSDVTLASGRGRTLGDTISWGALIYKDDTTGSTLFDLAANARITGFRLRGTYSAYDGSFSSLSDSVEFAVPNEYGITIIGDDGARIDNNEMYGWGGAIWYVRDAHDIPIEHNYFHHGNHIYHGYGSTFWNQSGDSTIIAVKANVWEFVDLMHGGATLCYDTRCSTSYNLFTEWTQGVTVYLHGDASSNCASGDFERNIFQRTCYGDWNAVTCIAGHGGNDVEDSVFIFDNWVWDADSQSAFSVGINEYRIYDNYFTPTPPSGMANCIPVASIWTDVTSGTNPLTIQFSAVNSIDYDGIITAAMWDFGDSCIAANNVRTGDFTDTFSYTYDTLGTYTARLTVIDDDGFRSNATVVIDVQPSSDDFLSCWIWDRYHGYDDGIMTKQIWINSTLWWEKDCAGNSAWEHVVLDITDTLNAYSPGDSIDLRFQLKINQTQGDFRDPALWFDDIEVYGAEVVNGNFEDGAMTFSNWSGTSQRTDGYWSFDEHTADANYFRGWETSMNVKGGHLGYRIGYFGAFNVTNGDSCYVIQRVVVD